MAEKIINPQTAPVKSYDIATWYLYCKALFYTIIYTVNCILLH